MKNVCLNIQFTVLQHLFILQEQNKFTFRIFLNIINYQNYKSQSNKQSFLKDCLRLHQSIILIHPQMYDCAQSAITFNNLNLATYDIHSKQSRQQILFNFHTLAQSFVGISTKHLNKSKQQNQRINQLRQRILRCKSRIDSFQTTNQALIFISPSEYPKKYKFDPQNNVSVFREYLVKTNVSKLDMSAHYQVKHQLQRLGEQSKLKLSELNNFIIFLMGQLQGKKKTAFERSLHPSRRKPQTLGHIPHNVQYIDSLTVFNSHINPYRKYEITNNIVEVSAQRNKKRQLQDIEKNQIVIDRELVDYSKPEFEVDSKRFVPQEKQLQMPEFDMDLQLDGIVNYGFNSEVDFLNQYADFDNIKKKNIATDPYATNAGTSKKDEGNSSQLSQSTSYSNNLPPPPPLNAKSQSSPSSILPPPPSLNLTLPPPPGLNLLPPPPSLNLPPPPSLNIPPPPSSSKILPPPPPLGKGLPPPPPLGKGLPPPSLGKPSPMPAASKGNDRSALLAQLQNPNPMARLKKTVTVQKGGIKPQKPQKPQKTKKATQASNNQQQDAGQPQIQQIVQQAPPVQEERPRQMSFMQALQAKIKSRFQALHPEQDSQQD